MKEGVSMHDMAFTTFVPTKNPTTKQNLNQIIKKLNQGLPISSFNTLKETLNIPQKELNQHLNLSEATLSRRQKKGFFTKDESEKIYRYLEILDKATELFENQSKASDWLKKPAIALNNQTPLSYAQTEQGAREVLNLITRLEYGVLG